MQELLAASCEAHVAKCLGLSRTVSRSVLAAASLVVLFCSGSSCRDGFVGNAMMVIARRHKVAHCFHMLVTLF